jgi:hypothetical protein
MSVGGIRTGTSRLLRRVAWIATAPVLALALVGCMDGVAVSADDPAPSSTATAGPVMAASFTQDKMTPEAIRALYERLGPLGLFEGAGDGDEAWARADGAETGYWYNEGVRRVFYGDGEALAEWGVCDFLERVQPLLSERGVPPLECAQGEWKPGAAGYTVTVNGRPFRILHERDYEENPTWTAATVRAFRMVETLLQEAGSAEHVYAIEGDVGLGSTGVLLTPEMAEVVNRDPAVPDEQHLLTMNQLSEWIIEFEE